LTVEPVRLAIPVYSVNIAAVVAVQAALADPAYVAGYLAQVAESKAILYAVCDRLGLRYWKSAANFVLVRVGDRVRDLVDAAAARKVYIRDRSTEPGCDGCVRVATGVVQHTERFVSVLEEVVCAAR
jgi:histidinol-phosphate aminotransferase